MEKKDLQIEGMHCGSCATGIQMVVSQMDGVANIFVSYDDKKGTVEFDPAKTKMEDILKSIGELGYTVTVQE